MAELRTLSCPMFLSVRSPKSTDIALPGGVDWGEVVWCAGMERGTHGRAFWRHRQIQIETTDRIDSQVCAEIEQLPNLSTGLICGMGGVVVGSRYIYTPPFLRRTSNMAAMLRDRLSSHPTTQLHPTPPQFYHHRGPPTTPLQSPRLQTTPED